MSDLLAFLSFLAIMGSILGIAVAISLSFLLISNKLLKKPKKNPDWTKTLKITKSSFSGWYYDRKSNRR